VLLPFIWIFNSALLLINVHGWWEILLVSFTATLASLTFAAATFAWFRIKCTWWEVALLLMATFILFRPDFFADRVAPEYTDAPASKFYDIAAQIDEGDRLVFLIKGESLEGDPLNKTVAVQLGAKVADPNPASAARDVADAGLGISGLGENLQVSTVKFAGSCAAKARIEQGFEIVAVKARTIA
jgi:hypothetical protein